LKKLSREQERQKRQTERLEQQRKKEEAAQGKQEEVSLDFAEEIVFQVKVPTKSAAKKKNKKR
jgi:hypothetical protein